MEAVVGGGIDWAASAVEIAKGRRRIWRSVMGIRRPPVGSNNFSVKTGMIGGRFDGARADACRWICAWANEAGGELKGEAADLSTIGKHQPLRYAFQDM